MSLIKYVIQLESMFGTIPYLFSLYCWNNVGNTNGTNQNGGNLEIKNREYIDPSIFSLVYKVQNMIS